MEEYRDFIANALGAQDGQGISSYAAGIAGRYRAIHTSVALRQLRGDESGQCGPIWPEILS